MSASNDIGRTYSSSKPLIVTTSRGRREFFLYPRVSAHGRYLVVEFVNEERVPNYRVFRFPVELQWLT